MAFEEINIGENPNDDTGDSLRECMRKVNSNFRNLSYNSLSGFNTVQQAKESTTLGAGELYYIEGKLNAIVPANSFEANDDTILYLPGSDVQAVLMSGDFDSLERLKSHPFLFVGQKIRAADRLYHLVPASTYTADGATVIDLTASNLQAVLAPGEALKDDDEFQADTRPDDWFTDGQYLGVGGPSGWTLKKVASNADRSTDGGSTWKVLPGMFGWPGRAFKIKADGVTDDHEAVQRAANVAGGSTLVLPRGVIRNDRYTLRIPPGTAVVSEGNLSGWRGSPFSNFVPDLYNGESGTTILLTGTGEKEHTVDFVTASTQTGYDRPNISRRYNNEFDERFELLDLTNKDASGTTPATLRAFSAGVKLGSGEEDEWDKTTLTGVRVVTSCPGSSETYGVGGYGDQSEIQPWDHWDVGVWSPSPWRVSIKGSQIVGYYDLRGVLFTSMAMSNTGDTLDDSGFSEFSSMEDTVVQGGFAMRSGDLWPIQSKTSSSITVDWTPSHRFPSSGTLDTSAGDLTYTGLTYNSGDETLTFTGISDTSGVDVSSGSKDYISLTSNGGFANSTFTRCEFMDFSHSTRIETPSPDFGSSQLPHRAAVELSGEPMRGIKFMNCLSYGNGPVMYHFGQMRDAEFYGCYTEPKSFKEGEGESSESNQALFICGPRGTVLPEIGRDYHGRVMSFGQHFVSYVSRAPLLAPNSGRRYASYNDAFNPLHFFDYLQNLGMDESTGDPLYADGDLSIQAAYGKDLHILTRRPDGTPVRAISAFASNFVRVGGSIEIFPSGNATINGNFRPEVDDTYDLGSAETRWDDVYATNGAINTSDQRSKDLIQDISEAEANVARKIKPLLKKYKLKKAIDEKGEGARWHFGVIAQEVVEAFASEGLDASRYGLLCYDEWPERKDDNGNVTVEAGSRYGIRYDELFSFLLSI